MYGLDASVVENEMHAIQVRGPKINIFSGYAAILLVLRQLPVTWPLLPLFWMFGTVGLGTRVYKWMATNRILVPDGTLCGAGHCVFTDIPPIATGRSEDV